jgi:hypothetical protein
MEFNICREFARSLNLKSAKEWFKYVSENNKDIPYHPERKFKNKGWVNWYDWLGKGLDKRIYKINDNYFKKNSRNMYYILGFWFADGYTRNNEFSITQHRKDRYILERMLLEMESDYPINFHYSNNLYIKITSKKIVDDIKKFGGHSKKSHTIQFPNIDDEFLSDFIRGFFDGDGCITYQKNEKCYTSSIISASDKFINTLIIKLRNNIKGFKGTITKSNYFLLNIGVNDTRRLRDYIYNNLDDNTLFLKRKYDKFILAGNLKIASFNKEFLSFNESRIFIKNNDIKTYRNWKKFKKINKIDNIPSNMDYYECYTGWKDFISI